MSGFFKKLFNRITGRKDEVPPPVAEADVPALPAPEPELSPFHAEEPPPQPEPEPETVLEEVQPEPEPKKPARKAKPAPPPPPPPKPKPTRKTKPKSAPIVLAPAGGEEGDPSRSDGEGEGGAVEPQLAPPVTPLTFPAASGGGSPSSPPQGERTIEEPPPATPGWLARLKTGLAKSSKSITGSITAIFTKRKLDAATLQELEDVLIQADLGLAMAERVVAQVSAGRYDKEIDPEEVKRILSAEIAKVLKPVEVPFTFGAEQPFVILVVGVNGSGKTTTIGKLGAIARREGFSVMLAACDTFRAAAIEQLTVWGGRIGARTISGAPGADSAGLAFDALKEARASGTDILIVDTAGRLQNKAHLMDELDKIVRVLKKQDAAAPHAVLLVLDATTGQNAIAQAEAFTRVAGVTGLIMTKLDGTARGGILVALAEKFRLPVHAIGVGEQIDDLQPFDAQAFARSIAGLD